MENPINESSHKAYRALKALQSVGGLHGQTIRWFIGLIILLGMLSGLLADTLPMILKWIVYGTSTLFCNIGSFQRPSEDPRLLITTSIIIGLLLFFIIHALRKLAFHHLSELRPTVVITAPSTATSIVMFLSTPNFFVLSKRGLDLTEDSFPIYLKSLRQRLRLISYERSKKTLLENDREDTDEGSVRREAFIIHDPENEDEPSSEDLRQFFKHVNWRMNIEALRPHIQDGSPLKQIVIIPSSGSKGSIAYLNDFKSLIQSLLHFQGLENVSIEGCGDIAISSTNNLRLPDSVPYEDVKGVVDILYEVTLFARRKFQCSERDVLVDITSGKALNSAAGLAFAALVEGRKVQYVDTETLKVSCFDVTHEVDLKTE